MAFREVNVLEAREVLRGWLAGAGLRTVAAQAGVDRKTARRYVQAAEAAGLVRDGGSRLRDELAAVTRELKDTSAAIDRYLIAFERGTLDDEDTHVRDRLATLKSRSKQLRVRKAQLELELEQPPQTLTPADQTKIRDRIRDILTGVPNAP